MAKPKKRKKKPGSGAGGGRPTSGPTVVRDRLPELIAELDATDHEGPAWGAVHKLLLTSALDSESLGLVIARRDRTALDRIAQATAARDGDLTGFDPYAEVVEEPAVVIDVDDETKRKAMRAFRKRLKFTRLDDESRLGVGPMTGGRASKISMIIPPAEFGREVWDALVRDGMLVDAKQGFFEMTDKA